MTIVPKTYYQFKQQIERLNVFDRIFVLVCVIIVIILLWFFICLNPQLNDLKETDKKIDQIVQKTTEATQKKNLVQAVSHEPQVKALMDKYKTLTVNISQLEKEYDYYKNRKNTPPKELSNFLHSMLKDISDVTIVDFLTVKPPVTTTLATPPPPTLVPGALPTPSPENPSVIATKLTTPEDKMQAIALETIRYKLVLRGNYFSIMQYLKKVEQLPWQLYWDKFNYSVSHYPIGIATIEFYTLNQGTELPIAQLGAGNG